MSTGAEQLGLLPRRQIVPLRAGLKKFAFASIRQFHVSFLSRELPNDLAIYFHHFEPSLWERFTEAVSNLSDRGYRCVSATEYCTAGYGDKRLFVSFDDNFSNWHKALEVFDALGVTATFYVNTLPFRDTCAEAKISEYFSRIAYRGPDRPMTRIELGEIADAGHRIGCHSHAHYRLSTLPREQWDGEIRQCKEELENLIARPVTDFSYPFGMKRHFTPDLMAYCRDIGFETIATGRPGLQHVMQTDPFSIHRTAWDFSRPLSENLENLRIDGRLFEALSGRSPIG